MNESNLILDNLWIENYHKNLLKQNFFFIEPIKKISIFNLYIKNNKIIFYHKNKIEIVNKKITNQKILSLIEKNKYIKSIKFKLKEILKFEIDIDNSNIEKFIKNNEKIKLINMDIYKDIYFKDTINIFKNLSCLYFIFEVNENIKKNITTHISVRKKNKQTKKYYMK